MVRAATSHCVKHLNPRQGITTEDEHLIIAYAAYICVKHLNPRQGITTCRRRSGDSAHRRLHGVKHLNPRQGITTTRGRTMVEQYDYTV